MCLSIALDDPSRVLNRGEHLGFQWVVTHNGFGYRCGYVRVPVGHPWHGKDDNDIDADVHGGLTFSEPDVPCNKGGPDDAHWFGFDCAHGGDGPDPGLPFGKILFGYPFSGEHAWTQSEVESQCRSLCEQASQAAEVGVASSVVPSCDC